MRSTISSGFPHLFGPVPSRRLGFSLGIDIIPFKTCTLDCLYCECGATTAHTMERRSYVAAETILTELSEYLKGDPKLDVLTFAGSGEPTLNSDFGSILRTIKMRWPQYKIAVLTNGTFLSDSHLRADMIMADYVLPSMDAVSEDVFKKLNNPTPGVTAQSIVDGLIAFSKEYGGTLWVEVFIVPGLNDTQKELAALKSVLSDTNLTRVQLNTLDRPGTSGDIEPASADNLAKIAAYFAPLPVEIISRKAAALIQESRSSDWSTVLSALARRPMTIEDIAATSGRTINDLEVLLELLLKDGKVRVQKSAGHTFYKT